MAAIQAAQNQKQTSTGHKLKIVAKIMVAVNIDMQDRLINGQTGNIRHIELDQGSTGKVSVKFSEVQAGLRAMKLHYLGTKNLWVPIGKHENQIKKG